MNELTVNPFAASSPKKQNESNAMAVVEEQRAIAETQSAMIIAKKFPRDPLEAMDKILQACTRKTLAEGALYSYSKGGSEVTGPSIRLAEVAAQCWGNMQFGIRELEQRNGESTVEAFAWDIETNTRQVKVFQVPHERYSRAKGRTRLDDPREIYELVANQGARRLRACILGVIPGDVIEAAQNQCEITMKANADTSPEALKKMADTFAKEFSVSVEMLQKRIQCRLEAIRPAQVVQLRKIYASLKDGMSKIEDWFDADESGASDPLAAAAEKAKNGNSSKKPESIDKKSGVITQEESQQKAYTYAEVREALTIAKTPAEVNVASKMINGVPEDMRDELDEFAANRLTELA